MVRACIVLISAILPMAAAISPSNKMPRRDPDLSLATPSTSVTSAIKQQLSIANLTQSYDDDVRATYECAYARMIHPTFCAVSFLSGAISYLPGVSVTSSASPSLLPGAGGSNTAITFSMSVVNKNPRYENALSTSALDSAASSATANSFVAQMVHVIGGSEHTAGVVVTLPSTSQVVMQSPDVSVGTSASAPPPSPAPPVASFAVTLTPTHFLGVLCIAFATVLP